MKLPEEYEDVDKEDDSVKNQGKTIRNEPQQLLLNQTPPSASILDDDKINSLAQKIQREQNLTTTEDPDKETYKHE